MYVYIHTHKSRTVMISTMDSSSCNSKSISLMRHKTALRRRERGDGRWSHVLLVDFSNFKKDIPVSILLIRVMPSYLYRAMGKIDSETYRGTLALKLRPRAVWYPLRDDPPNRPPRVHTDIINRYVFTNSCFANLNSNLGEKRGGGRVEGDIDPEKSNRTMLIANYQLRELPSIYVWTG